MGRPIKKVLFIEPRSPRPHIFSRVVIPRLGSVLLGTILQNQGVEVKVVVEEVAQPDYRNLDFKPDLVGISSISSTAPRAYALADAYREQGIPVVLGGAHPSFLPEEGLQHADYVVCGEGDQALPELLQAIEGNGDLSQVANVCYREDGQVHKNPWRPFLDDLDSLPIPNYQLIHQWRPNASNVSIATSRGCPFNCSFCSVIMMFGRKYRSCSVDRIMEEIRVNASRAKHIFFCDDNFTANRQRIKELCERLLRENIKIEWSAQVRVEAARDPELLDLMARAGCYVVFVGLESINPATLKAYNKSQDLRCHQGMRHQFPQVRHQGPRHVCLRLRAGPLPGDPGHGEILPGHRPGLPPVPDPHPGAGDPGVRRAGEAEPHHLPGLEPVRRPPRGVSAAPVHDLRTPDRNHPGDEKILFLAVGVERASWPGTGSTSCSGLTAACSSGSPAGPRTTTSRN